MAISNHERIGTALKLLNNGLAPFVERELEAELGAGWVEEVSSRLRDHQVPSSSDEGLQWDTQALLLVMWNEWNLVFRKTLGHVERSIVSELREVRNAWAHQERMSTDDTYRALDSMYRLLSSVSAADEAEAIDRERQDLLRQRFAEQARWERRKISSTPVEGEPAGGYRPWREVVTPHPDVSSGRYQQAEFAADLWQVYTGEGSEEYRDPTEFFRRTFLTEGLERLLVNGLRRLSGQGGDPVIELQTNFGGGKTHSLLALLHLFSGKKAAELPGAETLLSQVDLDQPPSGVNAAVFVGNKVSPGKPVEKEDGVTVNTIWGEIAWQLGGREAYELIREDDERATNPGDALRELFNKYAPCLILIDEWVAYARQLHDQADLPGGSFDTQFTFAQTLSEAAKAADRTLLVVSIPSSDIEVGGERGRSSLERLKNAIGRVESPWRPASAEESFEIVRRRLFQSITDHVAQDAVVKAFSEMYRSQEAEFPSGCKERSYERRLRDAYPIHPELFDRLFNDWSALDKFQRTRGVLRLMAAVIHHLWEREDRSLLILPSSVPVDAGPVQYELTRYLEDNWIPVIEKDVDGPNSLSLELDRDNPNLGRYSACRRVARTIYLGSAPTFHTANKGIDDRRVKLGCVQPGEAVATFGDALRRLSDRATYLYVDQGRYWYSTQQSVRQLATDRASQVDEDAVHDEIQDRVRTATRDRSEFARVHPFPASSGDVPDEREARLVVLGPDAPHIANDTNSEAMKRAGEILENRGSSPRRYRNTLVFLAADQNRLSDLDQAVRQYRAWDSITGEKEELNLDAFQSRQADSKRKSADRDIEARLPEVYRFLLVPLQKDPLGDMEWREIRLMGGEGLVARAARKLKTEELLVTTLGGVRLRMELDRIPLWDDDHVQGERVAENFAQYLYLPRLRDDEVLVEAIRDGLAQISWNPDTFAFADAWDPEAKRYLGLKAGSADQVTMSSKAVLVKPGVAAEQLKAEGAGDLSEVDEGSAVDVPEGVDPDPDEPVVGRDVPRRFYGSITVDPVRLTSGADEIVREVLQHLTGVKDAEVSVTLDIRATLPVGTPEHVVRTVTENCRTLKFEQAGFERE